MSVEMPAWCGACDQLTRRYDYGDYEQRCSDCHPYWAFGHSSVDPAQVPVSRNEQEQAVRWLLYELVALRAVQPGELRRRTSTFFESGWTLLDIAHALDFDPDGSKTRAQGQSPSATDERMLSERRVLNLLSAWCDEQGKPLPSPSQLATARHERLRERQQVMRNMLAELDSRQVTANAAEISGARAVAAQATAWAKQLRAEGQQRERAVQATVAAEQRAFDRKIRRTLRRLERMRLGVVKGDPQGMVGAPGVCENQQAAA